MAAILGHETCVKEWNNAFKSGRLHHAMVLFGTRGIGKARLALDFAKTLLEATIPGVAQMVDNLSHPDLYMMRSAEASTIKVDEVRKLLHFTHMTPGLARRKVVIIDAIDEMNRNAINALLKILEEPGNETYFLIVCHRAKGLPLTIRSRCTVLRFSTPEFAVFRHALSAERDVDPSIDLDLLYVATGGSIGLANHLLEEGLLDKIYFLNHSLKIGIQNLADALEFATLMVEPGTRSILSEISYNLEAHYLKNKLLAGHMVNLDQWFLRHDAAVKLVSHQEILHLEPGAVALDIAVNRMQNFMREEA
jgi:DNA polymerase-3 subunit delta'